MPQSKFVCLLAFALFPAVAWNQQGFSQSPPPKPGQLADTSGGAAPVESKRLFGVVPNYRTSPTIQNYQPVSVAEKFKLASQDSFDRGTLILAAIFAGEAQLANSEPTFGQGGAGYGRYLGTSYADFVIGNFMTEGVYPSLLHQDPRYFRKSSGGKLARLVYAAGQTLRTHDDHGNPQFNYSEILGNSTAVAISNAYYPSNRDAGSAVAKLTTQVGIDAAANILKEFWPEISRKLSRSHEGRQ